MTKQEMQRRTKTYFDHMAKQYDESHDGKFVRCLCREIVNQALRLPAASILDIGCGNGNVIRRLKGVKKAEYHGVDLAPLMIEEAKKRVGTDVDWRVADAQALPYQDAQFDLVICNASFHHYPEPKKAVAEIKRVLKPNGTLLLGDPTVPGKLLLKMLNWGLRFGNTGDYRIYGKKEILPLFKDQGFQIQEWKRLNYRAFVFRAVCPKQQ